jgi:hypothetical protein
MARHNKRYHNDPALEWSEFKKRSRLAFGIAFVVSVLSASYCSIMLEGFCYTATGEDEWNLAICPTKPGNITEMARVGESFRPLWWKLRNETEV